MALTQVSLQLTEAQMRQIGMLQELGFGTRSDIVRLALDRMYRQEMEAMHKLVKSIDYRENGLSATVHFEDGTSEDRHADANGVIDLSELYFRDVRSGQICRWGEDGAYEMADGLARL